MNLDECAREPIHIPGTIQPHGVLLVLSEQDLKILQVSESCVHHLGCRPAELLGRALDEVLGPEHVRQVRRLLTADPLSQVHPVGLELLPTGATRPFDAILHRHDGMVFLEMEPLSQSGPSSAALLFSVRAAVQRIHDTATIDQACWITAQEVAHLTGFDRVMIYRFDQAWNGEVIAEVRGEGQEPYLGLRFPASDIPEQARRLYALNQRRTIADVDSLPSAIVPAMSPLTGRTPDLSYSVLRSVSPIHLEYLRNMGVGATMSISIMRDNALWGLIACHHRAPRHLPYLVRSACESLAETFAFQIGVTTVRQQSDHRARLRRLCSELTMAMAETDNFTGLQQAGPALLKLVDASGAAVCMRDQLLLLGDTPTEQETRDLISWLCQQDGADRLHTACLSQLYSAALEYKDWASGLLFVSLMPSSADCVLWFRPEQIQTVHWAGDPHKPAIQGDTRLHPRRSFALWKERLALHSAPWLPWEIEAALDLCHSILQQEARERRVVADQTRVQLEVALARAQAATRAKSTFLANMSHEIRTPLNGCIGMIDMVFDSELSDSQREQLAVARDSAQSLLTIINDVLDLSKIEAGKLVLERTRFALRELIERTLRTLLPQAQKKGLALFHEVGADVPDALYGDPARLRQIVLNLVGNALKFTLQGEVSVRVLLDGRDGDSLRLRLIVRDTGIGIPPAAQALIFEPFTQADDTTTRRYGGTGLGLSICMELAHLMGGAIEIQSTPGEGSEFCLTARFGVCADLPVAAVRAAELRLPALSVLLAEDNPVNQRIACHMLKKLGLRVLAVSDGEAALAALGGQTFDLILMDVQMPQMDGLHATAQIRLQEAERGGHMPIVAMTAHSMEGDRERFLAAGMDDYVSKPVQLKSLAEAIGRVMGLRAWGPT